MLPRQRQGFHRGHSMITFFSDQQHTMCFLWITLNLTPETSTNCHIPSAHLQENKGTHPKEGWVLLSKQYLSLLLKGALPPWACFKGLAVKIQLQNTPATMIFLEGRAENHAVLSFLTPQKLLGFFLPHNESSREELYYPHANLPWKIRGARP